MSIDGIIEKLVAPTSELYLWLLYYKLILGILTITQVKQSI